MVDGIRGDIGKVGNPPVGDGADGAAAGQVAKQTPAGALAAPSLTVLPSSASSPSGAMAAGQAAAKALGAPVPLREPLGEALSPTRLGRLMTAIGGTAGDAGGPSTLDMNQLMLLMHDASRALRDVSIKQRSMSQQANIASQSAAIAEMQKAAVQRFIGAMVEGAVQGMLGVFALAHAAVTAKTAVAADQAKGDYQEAKALAKTGGGLAVGDGGESAAGAATAADVGRLKVAAQAAQRDVTRSENFEQSIQKIGGAAAKASTSGAGLAADESSVRQRQRELDASRHDAAANSAADLAGVARDRAGEILRTLASIQQSMNDATNAINRNM